MRLGTSVRPTQCGTWSGRALSYCSVTRLIMTIEKQCSQHNTGIFVVIQVLKRLPSVGHHTFSLFMRKSLKAAAKGSYGRLLSVGSRLKHNGLVRFAMHNTSSHQLRVPQVENRLVSPTLCVPVHSSHLVESAPVAPSLPVTVSY